MDAFQLAVRSFCNEVSYIQCNVKKDQFLNLIPDVAEDFEFDMFVALKVDKPETIVVYDYTMITDYIP